MKSSEEIIEEFESKGQEIANAVESKAVSIWSKARAWFGTLGLKTRYAVIVGVLLALYFASGVLWSFVPTVTYSAVTAEQFDPVKKRTAELTNAVEEHETKIIALTREADVLSNKVSGLKEEVAAAQAAVAEAQKPKVGETALPKTSKLQSGSAPLRPKTARAPKPKPFALLDYTTW